MNKVRAKKYLGQHFLNDENIAEKIVNSLTNFKSYDNVLEVGPGMGVLTKYLLEIENFSTSVVEIDVESQDYLKKHYSGLEHNIIGEDFLKMNLASYTQAPVCVNRKFPI